MSRDKKIAFSVVAAELLTIALFSLIVVTN